MRNSANAAKKKSVEEKSGERAIGKNVKKEDKTEVRNIGIRKSTNATKALRKGVEKAVAIGTKGKKNEKEDKRR